MTRQQKWARGAYAHVLRLKAQPAEKKYATLCMKTPALLQQAGLAQALAFLHTRKDARIGDSDIGPVFVDDLARVLEGMSTETAPRKGHGGALQRRALEVELRDYLALSRDVMAVAVWFRRFAQAELKAGED